MPYRFCRYSPVSRLWATASSIFSTPAQRAWADSTLSAASMYSSPGRLYSSTPSSRRAVTSTIPRRMGSSISI